MKRYLITILLTVSAALNAQCWKSVSLGADFCIALKQDGTLWAWGNNAGGQLGIGTFDNLPVPTQVGNASDWELASAGYGFVIALKSNGTVWVWGRNDFGLGSPTGTVSNIPVQVGADTDWTFVNAGGAHCFAIRSNGSLWAWGRNDFGQLGNNTFSHSNEPVQVGNDNNWKAASAGNLFSIAVKSDNTLWSWGYNFSGQLGLGTAGFGEEVNTPTQITAIPANEWKCVTTGGRHSLAITQEGALYVWGNNNSQALGINDGSTYKSTPTMLGSATDWKIVAGGLDHTLAIKEDNTLWGWGENTDGQLGEGSVINMATPIQVGTSTGWTSVDGGLQHSAFIKDDDILTSGSNDYGELGIDSTISHTTPQLVACPPLLSVNDNLQPAFILYPNPATERLHLQNTMNLNIDEIQIADTTGRIITGNIKDVLAINLQQLQSGTYWLLINTGDEKFHIQFIKI